MDKQNSALAKFFLLDQAPAFDGSVVTKWAIQKEINSARGNYVDHYLSLKEEIKLLGESLDDLNKLKPEVQQRLVEMLNESEKDVGYWQKLGDNVDEHLKRPIQIARAMQGKKQEIELLKWKMEFFRRQILILKGLRRQAKWF